jgi:transposase InsO family protein
MTVLSRKTEDISKEERQALLAQFKSSGLTHQEFAREHNINGDTFRNWIWINKDPTRRRQRYSPTERKKTVEAYLASGMTIAMFAKTWGVCASTMSDWIGRYDAMGSDGMMDRARRLDDKRLGMKVPVAVRSEIIEIKKKEPSYGLKRIKNWLYRFRGVKVSTGSIRKTVQSEGLPLAIKPRKRRRSSERVRRFERARPMQLWQSDITQFTMGPSSMRVYLTVFMDDHSRYIVGWRLQSKQTADLVIDSFKDAMVRFGKPEEVLTDQGRQYFAWRGKSELEKLLEKEGIKHVVSRAHHPQTLGKCERFWETVSNEFWTRAKPQDLDEARVRLKYFMDHYNHQRPHQGLNGMTPADRFFGIAAEVREIVEKTIEANSVRLSVGELPKAPAFLIGQVGDQRIAFHGTSGKFYLSNESLLGDENGNGSSHGARSIVSQFAIDRGGGGGGEEKESEKSAGREGAASSSGISSDSGEGSVECGDGRRAWTSETNSGEINGVVVGDQHEARGCAEFKHEADSVLASEQPGDSGNDGWPIGTAKSPAEETGGRDDGSRRDQYAKEDGS